MSSSTVQVLVDVFKFSRERSIEAVAAIKDPTDVQEAYNWLLDHGEPDQGGPVIPTQNCPHLLHHCKARESERLLPSAESIFGTGCTAQGCDSHENWLCLECGQVCCSRYAAGHSKQHYLSSKEADVARPLEACAHGHCIAASCSDLSIWCYECDKYVKHSSLDPLLQRLAELKFGEAPRAASPIAASRTAICFDQAAMDRHKSSAPPDTVRALEGPGRTTSVLKHLLESALSAECVTLPCVPAATADLLAVHDPAYLQALTATAAPGAAGHTACVQLEHQAALRMVGEEKEEGNGQAGAETAGSEADVFVNSHSFAAATAAAGSVLQLVRAVCTDVDVDGRINERGSGATALTNGFAICRPPGHHAGRAHAAGFCLLNNVAVAARYALDHFGSGGTTASNRVVDRVLVLDLDVHHGDGIQQIFYAEERVLYISIHRHEHAPGVFYPDEGRTSRVGEGSGRGRNVNVALPYEEGGFGDADYALLWAELVAPLVREYMPQLILVALGFDAVKGDPVGGFALSAEGGYGMMMRKLLGLAAEVPQQQEEEEQQQEEHQLATKPVPVVAALEGGYNHEQLGRCAEAVIRALLGHEEDAVTVPMAGAGRGSSHLPSVQEEDDEEEAQEEGAEEPGAGAKAGTRKAIEDVQHHHRPYWRCFSGATSHSKRPASSLSSPSPGRLHRLLAEHLRQLLTRNKRLQLQLQLQRRAAAGKKKRSA